MKIEGNCHCGAIACEAIVDPQKASLCHCADCQTLSGAPFRASVPAASADFHILRGQPKIYIKTADSGNKRAQAFCADCGTGLYSTSPENPTSYVLRVGVIAQRASFKPRQQIWCRSELPWTTTVGGVERREGQQ